MTTVAILTCSDTRHVLAVPFADALDAAAVSAAFGAAGCTAGQFAHTAQVRADTDALVWGGGLGGIEVVLPVLVAVLGVRALLGMVRR